MGSMHESLVGSVESALVRLVPASLGTLKQTKMFPLFPNMGTAAGKLRGKGLCGLGLGVSLTGLGSGPVLVPPMEWQSLVLRLLWV